MSEPAAWPAWNAWRKALDELHSEAGRPPQRELAAETGLGRATIHAVISSTSDRAFTWPIAETVITVLGGDPAQYRELFNALEAERKERVYRRLARRRAKRGLMTRAEILGRLRELRAEAGISLARACEGVDCGPTNLSRLEREAGARDTREDVLVGVLGNLGWELGYVLRRKQPRP